MTPLAPHSHRLPFPVLSTTMADPPAASGIDPGSGRYVVAATDVAAFARDGYVHLPQVLTAAELAAFEPWYDKFLTGELRPEGKDLCDMSGAVDRTPDQYTVYNAMLPRRYSKEFLAESQLYAERCADITRQLQGEGMVIDYNQILAKRPQSGDAVFPWHQDMAYWPPCEADPRTATCWLAMDDSTRENGCMRFIPGSHRQPLRRHRPVLLGKGKARLDAESSHALMTDVDEEGEGARYVEIRRGDITVHNELVVHGSGPNLSDGWRRAYVLALRSQRAHDEERAIGFTHSHNDDVNWDRFHPEFLSEA